MTDPDFADIFKRMACGKSLRAICAADGLAESSVRYRITADKELAAQYARAREAQADHYAEKIVDEAETATDAALGRLKMDALKWAASKMAPKRYGEKVQAELSGPDGGAIQTMTRLDATGLSDDQLRALASIKVPTE